MYQYYFLYLFPLISLININFIKKYDLFIFQSFFCFLFIFIGLKSNVGTDWGAYQRQFEIILATDILFYRIDLYDFAWFHINKIAFLWGFDVYFVNLFIAFIFCIGLYKILIFNQNKWEGLLLSLPVIIIIAGIGYTRQSAALGFVYLALSRDIDKERLTSLSYVIFAILFHKSAILILLLQLIIISYKRNYRYFLYFIPILFFIFFILLDINLIYKNYVINQTKSFGVIFRIIPFIFCSIYYLYIFFYCKNKVHFFLNQKFYFISSLLILFLTVIMFFISTIVDRLILYLFPLILIVNSILLGSFNKILYINLYKILLWAFSISSLTLWFIIGNHSQFWIPYNNLLFQLFD